MCQKSQCKKGPITGHVEVAGLSPQPMKESLPRPESFRSLLWGTIFFFKQNLRQNIQTKQVLCPPWAKGPICQCWKKATSLPSIPLLQEAISCLQLPPAKFFEPFIENTWSLPSHGLITDKGWPAAGPLHTDFFIYFINGKKHSAMFHNLLNLNDFILYPLCTHFTLIQILTQHAEWWRIRPCGSVLLPFLQEYNWYFTNGILFQQRIYYFI